MSVDGLGLGGGEGGVPAGVGVEGGELGVLEEVDSEFGVVGGQAGDVVEEGVLVGLGEGEAFFEAGVGEVALEVERVLIGFGGGVEAA